MKNILITTSTLPASETDEVPAFVMDQAIELKKLFPSLNIVMHAPHNTYSNTVKIAEKNSSYRVHRYHYFWPFKWELLAGRGIMPALKKNPLLYFQIPFLIFFHFISLLAVTLREKPELLYAHWFTPQAMTTALVSRITKIPFVFTTHASDVSVLNRFPFSKSLVNWVCRRACSYIAVSESTAKKLTHFFAGASDERALTDKLSIIPMGVSTDVHRISESERTKVLSRFRLPKDRQCMLFLGRLAEKKGVSCLLEAVAQLPSTSARRLHLIIAGDGQLRGELEDRSHRLGLTNVTFTGYVTGQDKWALIDTVDYACFPSIIDSSGDAEGFPVAIMECLAAGKIVLSSNVTGAEKVINEYNAGFVFPEKSAASLASLLENVLTLDQSRKNKLQTNAKRLALNYDWRTISQQHYSIFLKCCNDGI
ncbi:hypothetical protein Tel_00725 [Candidatus Tenderia electrophaga]|jgi:glycosyltransferase involved in cell wall biosynthesis|uniref:Glycosyl transferase family 1 n=1 Tax=Candidatus Tenderia electrophaga TaxID=1748243 RepID=A0A0S2T9F3_9GAMM|nr:hypothetical protein Tel_00725 [Candidatus Tenderia electrophaga]